MTTFEARIFSVTDRPATDPHAPVQESASGARNGYPSALLPYTGHGARPDTSRVRCGTNPTRGRHSNGAGKTTLLRAVSRLINASGTLRFAGRDLGRLTPEEVFSLGLVQVPEGRQLFDRMSIEDNLRMGAYRRTDAGAIRESFERVYQMFPVLKERRRQIAGSMSGGEQQMCAIGRALMAAPKLLVVDEMSLGLAPVVVDQLLEVLAEIRKAGITVLLVEQDVFAAFSIADRGYVMETGRIVREGTASELSENVDVQRAYLGVH